MKPIFLAPVAAVAIAGAATGAYFWLTAEGTVEEMPLAQQEASPTPTPDATPAQGHTPTPAPALAQPSPQPVPDDWLTYTDAETGVTLRYPPDWVVQTPPSSIRRIRLYKVVASPPQLPAEAAPPVTASVSIYGCCASGESKPFFEPWTCDSPEKTEVGGYLAERCTYTRDDPIPGGFTMASIGAEILYTVHTPGEPLYISSGLFTWDETGTMILDTWNAEDAEDAERIIMQGLKIAQ